MANTGLDKAYASLPEGVEPEMVQGGRITSYTFGAEVDSVAVRPWRASDTLLCAVLSLPSDRSISG